MKKIISVLLCLVFVFALVGCGKSENSSQNGDSADVNTMVTVLDPTEYVLYQNIFYNEQGSQYVGKEVTKKGVFTKLFDEYNSTVRYYVWGYNDNTKCCDWQWEIIPSDTSNLPKLGSTVEATGVFAYADTALDGYYIDNATITVTHEYTASEADVDMTTMGGTLERVQLQNIQQFSEKFEGNTVAAYGRVETPTSIQHPYYDNCFSQQFVSQDDVQAIGRLVIVKGTYRSGVITDAEVKVTTKF